MRGAKPASIGSRRTTRHTFGSLMIAAGVNAKALQTFMGVLHHLMPGSEDEAAGLLDAYLAAQRERAEDAPGRPARLPLAH
jgi:hypothetical protein